MNKLHIYLMMLLTVLLNSCGQPPPTTAPHKSSDSIYRYDYIYDIAISEPQRALALADTAEMLNLLRPDHTCLNAVQAMIYQNGLRQLKLAKIYCRKAYEDAEFKKDTTAYLNNLTQLTGLCYKSSDYAAAIRYASQGLQMARTHGWKNLEAKFLMYIGMSQAYIGIIGDAKANMNRCIALCEEIVDKEQSWSNVNDLIYTLGETMDVLCVMGAWQEAATLIPNILKANNLHEQLASEAPAGAIDMYKAFVYAQCMEIYLHTDDKVRAAECYQKCLSTDYAMSPEGTMLPTRYLLWTKDYPQALHNIQIAKQIYQQKRNTESEYYADRLLADEVEALTGLERYKEAADVSRRIIALKDTLFKRKQQDDVRELAIIYETGEKEAQLVRQATQLKENRMILSFAVCIIGLLGMLLWRIVRHSRIIRKKNKAMAGTITGLLKYKEELYRSKGDNLLLQKQLQAAEEALRQHNTIKASQPNVPEELPAKAEPSAGIPLKDEAPKTDVADGDIDPDLRLLFERVEHEIISKELFLRPELSRDELMKLLRISKNKFAPLFKLNTGLKYSQYINKLRMEYAAKLLQEQPDYSMDAIAQSCGILSGSTFYRLFNENYGMTPLDYRKSIKAFDNNRNQSNDND